MAVKKNLLILVFFVLIVFGLIGFVFVGGSFDDLDKFIEVKNFYLEVTFDNTTLNLSPNPRYIFDDKNDLVRNDENLLLLELVKVPEIKFYGKEDTYFEGGYGNVIFEKKEEAILFSGNVISVCKSGVCDYAIIQEALNSAMSGDTVLVTDGSTYEENIVWPKNYLTLDCRGAIISASSGDVISLSGNKNNVIKNCRIKDGEIGIIMWFGSDYNILINNSVYDIQIYGINNWGSYNEITGNKIFNNGWAGIINLGSNNTYSENEIYGNGNNGGIQMRYGKSNRIINNLIYDNLMGIRYTENPLDYTFGMENNIIKENKLYRNQIRIINSKNEKIINNEIAGTLNGINVFGSRGITFQNNSFFGNGFGLILRDNSQNITISNNNFSMNPWGSIFIFDSSFITISYNLFLDNRESVGLNAENSHNIEIFRNNFLDNYFGIVLHSSSNNAIFNNNLRRNRYGILFSSSSDSKVEHNNFYGNIFYHLTNSQAKDILAEHNWWGTTNELNIREKIHDCEDDSSLGCVYFIPYLTSPWDTGYSPQLSNLLDKTINQDSRPPARWIDLWDYVYDEDTPKNRLTFSIQSQSNPTLINCWIDVNRYVTCGIPEKGQVGSSDVTVKVMDPQGNFDTDTFRVNVNSPSLTILFVPFDWKLSRDWLLRDISYNKYTENSEEIAEYFLERIPLSDCKTQFNFLMVEENKDYGDSWDGWKCDLSDVPPFIEFCYDPSAALKRLWECGMQYAKSTQLEYTHIVGITDRGKLAYYHSGVCGAVGGWSDLGRTPAVIARTSLETVTHELGHEFGLRDQYCDCRTGSHSVRGYCGPHVSPNPLKTELGCDPDDPNDSCCWETDQLPGIYQGCRMCRGNFDRFGEDTNNNGDLDTGDRTIMSSNVQRNHFDKNEYFHLQIFPIMQCKTQGESQMKNLESEEPDFYIQIMLNIDKEDNVELRDLSFINFKPFIREDEGDYILKILDIRDVVLYENNFSVFFEDLDLTLSLPIITNESAIYDVIEYQEGMERFEIYHNEILIFSHDISSFCNFNNVCEPELGENYISCPSDCESNAQDGICNRQAGIGCDFDCAEGVHSDCYDMAVENVTLIREIRKAKPTEIEINFSNYGLGNATFDISLVVSGIEEANITVNVTGEFSGIEKIIWTPQQECSQSIIVNLDSRNQINEMNKTNNEFKISDVKIYMQADVNLDNKVDIFDLATVGLAYGSVIGDANWNANADLNNDGIINIFDLAIVGMNYGREC